MSEKVSRVWAHYQKLQESLTELMDPGFSSQTNSFTLIVLNQTYTNAERLFELVEETTNLSRSRQVTLAKLANHIENTKEKGISREFIAFIQADLTYSLTVIKDLFQKEFGLAS